jgi:hypothetical protein
MPKRPIHDTVTGQFIQALAQSGLPYAPEPPMRFIPMTSFTLSVLCATQSFAETPMTATEFEAYSTGKTMTYSVGGQVFGTEQYLPDRHVVWAFKGDDCTDGIWYEEAGLICFVYKSDGTPQCWTFYLDAAGLRAKFVGDGIGSELSVVSQSPAPMACMGPDVGV